MKFLKNVKNWIILNYNKLLGIIKKTLFKFNILFRAKLNIFCEKFKRFFFCWISYAIRVAVWFLSKLKLFFTTGYLIDQFFNMIDWILQAIYRDNSVLIEKWILKIELWLITVFNATKTFLKKTPTAVNYIVTVFLLVLISDRYVNWFFGGKVSIAEELVYDLKCILIELARILISNGLPLIAVIFSLMIAGFLIIPRYISTPGLSAKVCALTISTGIFALTLFEVFVYDFKETFELVSKDFVGPEIYEAFPTFFFVIDPISLTFGLLVSFIFPIIILVAWDKVQYRQNFFYFNIILLEICVLGAFYTLDLFLFFIFFEAMFIPMSLLILIWGGRQRKVKAATYIFLYTLLGSAFFLTALIYIYTVFKSTNYFYILSNLNLLSKKESYCLWVAFFIPFAIKIPMFPFHIWLPEAHVEAPTAGSIALAAILLKLGGYGFIRFLIPLFYEASIFFSPLVTGLALVGVVYGTFAAIRQTDIKKIIAYSSIAHMNIVVLGIFSFDIYSLYGAITLMVGHGLTSSALFFLAGVLYDRHHTRSLFYYGGLAQVMPLFSSFFFFFTAANLGFPCSISFIGEFFIFLGVFKELGLGVSLIIGFSSVLGVYLNMLLFISINFGPLSSGVYQDLSSRELKILIALTLASFVTFLCHSKFFVLLSGTNSLYYHLFM